MAEILPVWCKSINQSITHVTTSMVAHVCIYILQDTLVNISSEENKSYISKMYPSQSQKSEYQTQWSIFISSETSIDAPSMYLRVSIKGTIIEHENSPSLWTRRKVFVTALKYTEGPSFPSDPTLKYPPRSHSNDQSKLIRRTSWYLHIKFSL